MMTQLPHLQKKIFSLTVAIILVFATYALRSFSCAAKRSEQAAEQKFSVEQATAVFLTQGNGRVRHWTPEATSAAITRNHNAGK